jgi:hypothetical protein
MKYAQHRPSRPRVHSPALNPIRVHGPNEPGLIEVSAVDGQVHIAIGETGAYLDRAAADDLMHAVAEAMEATR